MSFPTIELVPILVLHPGHLLDGMAHTLHFLKTANIKKIAILLQADPTDRVDTINERGVHRCSIGPFSGTEAERKSMQMVESSKLPNYLQSILNRHGLTLHPTQDYLYKHDGKADDDPIHKLIDNVRNPNHPYRYVIINANDEYSELLKNANLELHVFDKVDDRENRPLLKLLRIQVACENYLQHLNASKPDTEGLLDMKKIEVKKLIDLSKLSFSQPAVEALKSFKKAFKGSRVILEQHRDSNAMIFLKIILTALSLGFARQRLWKVEGQELTHALDATLGVKLNQL